MSAPPLSLLASASLLLASPALAQKTPDVRVDLGDPAGSAASFKHALAVEGSSVYVAWADYRNTPFLRGDIYFNRSLDAGRTWLASAVRLDRGSLPGADCSTNPDVAAVDGAVYVVWMDTRGFEGRVYFNRSFDDGLTWDETDQRIDRGSAPANLCSGIFPRVGASGSAVHVVWVDDRDGVYDVRYNRSQDGGSTWMANDVRLDLGAASGASDSGNVRLAVLGSTLYVVWAEFDSSSSSIYANVSLDGGSTWLPGAVRVDVGGGGTGSAARPVLAAEGSALHVAWLDGRNGLPDVYYNRSLDAGATWLPADVRLDVGKTPGSAVSDYVDLAASAGSVYAAWGDTRAGSYDVWFNRSLDGGTSWLGSDVRLDVGSVAGSSPSQDVDLEAVGPVVLATWWDVRQGDSDVYLNRSLDSGSTWLDPDVRLDVGTAPGTADARLPRLAADASGAHVIWQDQRDGDADIYYNLALGHQPYGTGTPGTGGLVPVLAASDAPGIGASFTLQIANARGGASALVAYGFDGPIAVAVLGGLLLVSPPLCALTPPLLGGAAGVPGAGSTSFAVPVPNDPSFLGLRVNLQAIVFDPAAIGGLALTGAVETWIL